MGVTHCASKAHTLQSRPICGCISRSKKVTGQPNIMPLNCVLLTEMREDKSKGEVLSTQVSARSTGHHRASSVKTGEEQGLGVPQRCRLVFLTGAP